ncbi:MAG: hypothetical protein RBS89_07260 [Candidatus Delongbacteria bacterium]|jgi:hypothetical protein|nr:hypothetical protein [Candidatus Delongbacteria bacterium]
MNRTDFIIPQTVLEHIEGTPLYYPCSGRDTLGAVKLFAPFVNDFLFVDIGYYTNHTQMRVPSPKDIPGFVLISRKREGPPRAEMVEKYDEVKKEYYQDMEPCIVTETYFHEPTGKTIKFRLKRGFAEYTLKHIENKIGVFYYRGDGNGEGGSGITWLGKKRMNLICDKLIDGGLIVTDGSNGSRNHKQFRKYHNHRDNEESRDEMMKTMTPFKDTKGRTFTCVGYGGERYGPTFIWQVHKQKGGKIE